jgi:hypothetical protein
MKMIKNRIREFVQCACGAEGLLIEEWIDMVHAQGELVPLHEYWFSMLAKPGYWGGRLPTLRSRLRYAWNVMKTGKPYADELIFKIDELKKIKEVIDRLIENAEDPIKEV